MKLTTCGPVSHPTPSAPDFALLFLQIIGKYNVTLTLISHHQTLKFNVGKTEGSSEPQKEDMVSDDRG